MIVWMPGEDMTRAVYVIVFESEWAFRAAPFASRVLNAVLTALVLTRALRDAFTAHKS